MRSVKKIISAVLSTILCLSILVSCGLKEQSGNNVIIGGNNTMDKISEEYYSMIESPEKLPVSFTYGDTRYEGFGSRFKRTSLENEEYEDKICHTLKLNMENSPLEVTVNMALYKEYNAYEWTVYFTNTGNKNSLNLSDMLGVDVRFAGADPVVRGLNGDLYGEEFWSEGRGRAEDYYLSSYTPYKEDFTTTDTFVKTSRTGRTTHDFLPYFNFAHGNDTTLIAIGWPGTMKVEFKKEENDIMHFTAGQLDFSAYLEPGETVRTPLVAMLFCEGRDYDSTMNVWRGWIADCNLRKTNGELLPAGSIASYAAMTRPHAKNTEAMELRDMRKYVENGVPVDWYWLDWGWYAQGDGSIPLDKCENSGNWQVDTSRYPSRFADLSAYGKEHGIRLMVWFEQEIIRTENKEYLYSLGLKKEWLLGGGYLFDMGQKEAREWMLSQVCKVIDEGGVEGYNSDFNANPGDAWRSADAPDRTGITENHYVQGYLEYWDALIERYPDMVFDSCASGGGRNDLETMRRMYPLHKTDCNYDDYEHKQEVHINLFQWFPYFGSPTNVGINTLSTYGLRSTYCPWMLLCYNPSVLGFDIETLKACCDELKSISGYYYADYYPLTDVTDTSDKLWRGWEFFDPDKQEGFIQLFRPSKCEESSYTALLRGLDAESTYILTDMDGRGTVTATGLELMEEGYTSELTDPSSAAVVMIRRQ